MSKRKSISKKVRFEIFKRDDFTCQYCGSTPPAVVLHVDHINPVANGGDNSDHNLVTACEHCNMGKSANLLTSVPRSLAKKASDVAEREEQIRGYYEVIEQKNDRILLEAWRIVAVLQGVDQADMVCKKYMTCIKMFLQRLPYHEVEEAAEICRSKYRFLNINSFKYFCGICWTKIKRESEKVA